MGVTTFHAMYLCKGLRWEAKGDRASWIGQRREGLAFSVDRLVTCTSDTQRRGDRANPYDYYIRRGESYEKIDCSIESAWIEAGAVLNESGHSEVGGYKREWMGIKSDFLWCHYNCLHNVQSLFCRRYSPIAESHCWTFDVWHFLCTCVWIYISFKIKTTQEQRKCQNIKGSALWLGNWAISPTK